MCRKAVSDYEKDQEDAGNEGTLIIDATCAPANIRYPQDAVAKTLP